MPEMEPLRKMELEFKDLEDSQDSHKEGTEKARLETNSRMLHGDHLKRNHASHPWPSQKTARVSCHLSFPSSGRRQEVKKEGCLIHPLTDHRR